ncbi:unnamed protein product [Brassicogethes aeneus]|uniref:Flexible cuticle protein 12 n=1 Tax=Brassicogethes aeneus TaxID=1431903 RepID=A0A9P0FIG4_BRAAE|nr:unnamed protein product [Brassicogethes aeneus]
MKVFVVLFALVTVSLAASLGGPESTAEVLKSHVENIGVEGFNYGYETSNGIAAEETGHIVNAGAENEAVAVQGSYKYTAPDGVVYAVTYIADENGFQPQVGLKSNYCTKVAVLVAVLAVAAAAPQRNPEADATVIKNVLDNIGTDGYQYAYETSNQISAQEQGQLINPGTENESISVRGSYRYLGPDGVVYEVTYIADDNGFQPQGAHLPVIALFALVAVILAAPQGLEKDATVLRNDLENIGTDGFNYAYETSNGISAQEQGQLNNAGTENESLSVRGSYRYIGIDGQTYEVTYIADENGFQPQGAHLPVAN